MALYALVSVALIGIAAGVLIVFYRAPAERGAVGASALEPVQNPRIAAGWR